MIFSKVLNILFFLFLIWITGLILFIYFTPKAEIEHNKKVDAIIVLTGARGRIDAGLELLSKNQAKALFISGVGKRADLDDLSKHLPSFPLDKIGNLRPNIYLGYLANSTKENASESLEWIKKNNYKKIILVTSNFHILRSIYLFKYMMPDVEIIPYPIVHPRQYTSYLIMKLFFIDYNKLLFSYIHNVILK